MLVRKEDFCCRIFSQKENKNGPRFAEEVFPSRENDEVAF